MLLEHPYQNTLGSMVLFPKRRSSVLSFFIIPFAAFLVFTLHHGNEPMVTGDTPGYLYFAGDRPIGYPLFLAMVRLVFGSYTAALPLQLGLLCASFGILAWSYYAYSGNFWQSLVFEGFLVLNPGQFLLAGQLMSDPLSAVCISIFAATVLFALVRPNAALYFLIAITGVAVLIRPVNLALVPATALTLLMLGGAKTARWTQLSLFALSLLLAHEATPFVHWLRGEPVERSDPLARGLFQKTLFKQWPQTPETDACEGQLVAQDTKQVDEYLAHSPPDITPYLLEKISGYIRFSVIVPELVQKHNFAHFSGPDSILKCYALARMKADPLYFMQSAAEQFWSLLTYSTYVSQATHDKIENYLTDHPPGLPPRVERGDIEFHLNDRAIQDLGLSPNAFSSEGALQAPRARPQILANGLRAFQIAGALVMLAGMLSFIRRPAQRRVWRAIGILGITFFVEMTITSIVEIAFPRYVYPLWPLLCTAMALFASLLLPPTPTGNEATSRETTPARES